MAIGTKAEKIATGWRWIFAYLLLDSLFTYFLSGRLGYLVPVNAMLPVFIIIMGMLYGFNRLLPDGKTLAWIAALTFGFSVGIAFNEDLAINRFLKLGSAAAALVIGYNFGRWNANARKFSDLCLSVSLVYVVVCVVAILKIAPALFPVIEAWGFKEGELLIRPEITIDQNFQIYYLFFCVFPLALSFSPVRYALSFAALLGALYTVFELKTRSGSIFMLLSFLLCFLYPVLERGNSGKIKIVALSLVLVVAFIYKFEAILEISAGILDRFLNDDFHTFWGRVHSATYLFQHIYNPLWWLPQGNRHFIELYSNIPHFNPTAVFLEGGIIALVAWVALVLAPLFSGAKLVFTRRINLFGVLVFIGATITFGAGLTLNAALYEHSYLWAGALIGVLVKEKEAFRFRRTAYYQQTKG